MRPLAVLTVTTAFGSGYVSTVVSSPFDVVKSRVMGQVIFTLTLNPTPFPTPTPTPDPDPDPDPDPSPDPSPDPVVNSRGMSQPMNPDGTGKLYAGMVDCFLKSSKSEGPMSLYNGFWPNFGRVVRVRVKGVGVGVGVGVGIGYAIPRAVPTSLRTRRALAPARAPPRGKK